jgi:GNAT superfamily N-acetyltransferase
MIRIRPATIDDLELVHRFIVALAEYERLAHEVVCTRDDLRSTLFGEKPAAEIRIAHYDGVPVGFALFFTSYSTFLGKPGIYLEDLFVLPECRGKGVGKALLAHLAALTRQRGYGRLEWSVLDWNEPSIQFYRSVGAVGKDEWTTFRLVDDALFALADQASA